MSITPAPAATTPAVTTPAGAIPDQNRRGGEHQLVLAERGPDGAAVLVKVFVVVPTLALIAAVALAWGWG